MHDAQCATHHAHCKVGSRRLIQEQSLKGQASGRANLTFRSMCNTTHHGANSFEMQVVQGCATCYATVGCFNQLEVCHLASCALHAGVVDNTLDCPTRITSRKYFLMPAPAADHLSIAHGSQRLVLPTFMPTTVHTCNTAKQGCQQQHCSDVGNSIAQTVPGAQRLDSIELVSN